MQDDLGVTVESQELKEAAVVLQVLLGPVKRPLARQAAEFGQVGAEAIPFFPCHLADPGAGGKQFLLFPPGPAPRDLVSGQRHQVGREAVHLEVVGVEKPHDAKRVLQVSLGHPEDAGPLLLGREGFSPA